MFDDEIGSYLSDEEKQEIAEEFFAKGIEQGEAKERAKMAKAMLADGKDVEEITRFTGLSPEEVEALR